MSSGDCGSMAVLPGYHTGNFLETEGHDCWERALRETSRHQSASKEKEENKNSLKIITFDSQVSLVNTYVTGFGKEKEGTFKNLGLIAAQ